MIITYAKTNEQLSQVLDRVTEELISVAKMSMACELTYAVGFIAGQNEMLKIRLDNTIAKLIERGNLDGDI